MDLGTRQVKEDFEEQAQDTEITLGTGKLLGIFFVVVIVCAVFFTMGYLLGKSTNAGGRTEIVATVPSGNAAGKPQQCKAREFAQTSRQRLADRRRQLANQGNDTFDRRHAHLGLRD